MAGKNCKRKKMQDGGALDFSSGKTAQDYIDELKAAENKTTTTNVLTGIGSGAATGLAAGSVLPGIGNLVGLIGGAIIGGIGAGAKRGIETSGNKERYTDIERQYEQYLQSIQAEGAQTRFGYRKGGKIKGKGTAKSDSIKTEMPQGSFVVPAENAATAMEIGQNLLGWSNDKKAPKRKDGVPVDLSNGEVIFMPDEVKALMGMGLDLNQLAPNAEPGNRMANGGFAGIEEELAKRDANRLRMMNTTDPLTDYIAGLEADMNKSLAGEEFGRVKKEKLPKEGLDAATKAGIIGGAAQSATGIAGLIAEGKAEMPGVSNELNQLAVETAREAEYGLEPAEKAAAERKIQRNVNRAIDAVAETTSGGPQSSYNRIANLLAQGNEDVANLLVIDENLKREKKGEARKYKYLQGQRKDYLADLAFTDHRQGQDLLADAAVAGLENIIGSLQYRQAVEAKKQRDKINNSLIS